MKGVFEMRTVDRILATSDIHGQNTKFLNLLKTADYEPNSDLLVVCGDLIDRGEENLETLATCIDLQKKGAIILKGNHEQFLEQALKEMITDDCWNTLSSEVINLWVGHNGGATMYEEIKDLSHEKLIEILKFVRNLPLYFETGKYIFTHAGANTRKPIEKNTENEVVWMENSFPSCPGYKDKIMLFGHVPTWLLHQYKAKGKKERKNTEIWFDKVNKDKIGLDCGGVFGGRLAMLELPRMIEFYE